MKKNNTISEIAEKILNANSILIFPHVSMDGDTLGSSTALCRVLRQSGKTVHILIEDEIPEFLKFLNDGSCTFDQDIIKEPDVCISIDAADPERFSRRKEAFFKGKTTICVDHHKTSNYFAEFNHVDITAAATAEIVYELINEMKLPIDKLTGEAIYAAILTDTGNFQYSNTSAKSHLIAVALLSAGIDCSYVNRMLYQNNRIERLFIAGKIFATLKSIADGKVVIAYVTQAMLKEAGALPEDAEGVAEILRNLAGVEVGVFAKEIAQNETKFSMRSETWADVSEISIKHGGGGHKNAAGFTVKQPIAEAIKTVEQSISEYFAEA